MRQKKPIVIWIFHSQEWYSSFNGDDTNVCIMIVFEENAAQCIIIMFAPIHLFSTLSCFDTEKESF